MVDGFSRNEVYFLGWAMYETKKELGRELSWREYLIVIWVLHYLIESGLYKYVTNRDRLFRVSDIYREYRKAESAGVAV